MKVINQLESANRFTLLSRIYGALMIGWGLFGLMYAPVILMACLIALIIQWTRATGILCALLGGLLLWYSLNITPLASLTEFINPWSAFNLWACCSAFELWLSPVALSLLIGALWQGIYQLVHYRLCVNRIKVVSDKQEAAGAILGTDMQTGKPIYLHDGDANLHTLIVGTTGSGKTTAVCNILQSAIDRRQPTFYVDGKGDLALASKVAAYAKSKNLPFYLFSMIDGVLKYNPLSSGGITAKKDRIIELRHWSEDHYRKIAENYLQTVLKILERCEVPLDLVTLAKHLDPDYLFLIARKLKDQSLAEAIGTLEQKQKDIGGLIAEIETMAHSEIGHLFDCSSGKVMTLKQVVKEQGMAYFCLQPLAFPAYASTLGKLIINDIKSLAGEQLNQVKPLTMFTVFDEFSVFAGDQIVHLINQGRSAGVCAILLTQSLSDISRRGGMALVGQILNNCNNFIIQRQNNPSDAVVLADVIGTKEGYEVSTQLKDCQDTVTKTIKPHRSYLVHPDIIKRLPRGQAVFVQKQIFKAQMIQLRKGAIG